MKPDEAYQIVNRGLVQAGLTNSGPLTFYPVRPGFRILAPGQALWQYPGMCVIFCYVCTASPK